jgi:hypothetical protein
MGLLGRVSGAPQTTVALSQCAVRRWLGLGREIQLFARGNRIIHMAQYHSLSARLTLELKPRVKRLTSPKVNATTNHLEGRSNKSSHN